MMYKHFLPAMNLKILTKKDVPKISPFIKELNPKLSKDEIEQNQMKMFDLSTYTCFGLCIEDNLIGISSGWTSIKHYSGKQIEIDNVIIKAEHQSKGCGKTFMKLIEKWSISNGCKTIELNSYVSNAGSHKFYFNEGFSILGFHFWKQL